VDKADEETDVLAKIAEMPASDRAMGERLHALIKASAPALSPRQVEVRKIVWRDGRHGRSMVAGQPVRRGR
jgi:hypothetical protein